MNTTFSATWRKTLVSGWAVSRPWFSFDRRLLISWFVGQWAALYSTTAPRSSSRKSCSQHVYSLGTTRYSSDFFTLNSTLTWKCCSLARHGTTLFLELKPQLPPSSSNINFKILSPTTPRFLKFTFKSLFTKYRMHVSYCMLSTCRHFVILDLLIRTD